MTEGDGLRVETLGPLRAFAGGEELPLGPPKQRAVFAVLALSAGGVVGRDVLVDRIWGASPPATATGSLHTYLSGLRRALSGLDEALTTSEAGYGLRLDPDRLDVRVVERLATRARGVPARQDPAAAVDALTQALACWRPGTVLGGLPGPFAAGYRTWTADLRLGLLLDRAELLLAMDQPAGVADQLHGHTADNPYHERLRSVLMLALRRSGRTADALAQYHDLRRLLAEDLGIDPSAELQALYASLLEDAPGRRAPGTPASPAGPAAAAPGAGSPPAPRTPPSAPAAPVRPAQLPRGVGRFAGRVEAVRQVLDAGRAASANDGGSTSGSGSGGSGSPQILMVVGVGGVGKTALAVHCAHRLADAYPDGQVYVNLRGFDPKSPASSPTDVLQHLLASVHTGTVPSDLEGRIALWRSIVRDRSMLVVLDNAESAEQVEDLLPGDGPSFVLVTSRNRLSGLAVRYAARRVTLQPFTTEESLQLLADSIGPARVDAEPVAARRLADLCDHLPLALRIASEQVTAGAQARIADLVAELEDVQRRLDALQIPDDELCSVRGVLSWSYARLDAEAAHALRTLGMFPGVTIRLEVAAALLDVSPAAAAAVLRRLAAQHLVESSGGVFWMHDLTRIYAEEVSRSGETAASRRAALERVLDWYVRTLAEDYRSTKVTLPFALDAEPRHEPLRFADRKDFVGWCAQEWANIAPLVRAAQRAGCHDGTWQLAYLLFGYFYAAGQAREWLDTLRIGMRSAELVEDRRAQVVLLNHMSVAHSRVGENDAAVRQLEHGLQLLPDLGDDMLLTSLLGNMASTLREAKRYPEALPYAAQALNLAQHSGLDYYAAGCLDVLCELHAELGAFENALWYGRFGLTAARRCRNVLLEANILINLGAAEFGLGHTEAAAGSLQDALALCSATGDQYHEGLALFGLAKMEHATGAGAARELAGRALLRLADLDAEEVADVREFLRMLDAESAPASDAPPPREPDAAPFPASRADPVPALGAAPPVPAPDAPPPTGVAPGAGPVPRAG